MGLEYRFPVSMVRVGTSTYWSRGRLPEDRLDKKPYDGLAAILHVCCC